MDYHPEPDEEEWVEEEEDADGDLLVCPSCHRSVHEETQQCPHCGDWIIPAYPESRGGRFVWGVVVGLMIISLLMLTVC